MKSTIRTLLTTALLLGSVTAQAAQDSQTLITGCQELTAIYAKRDEKHLYAAITTSREEAFRAGYCRGMLEQYRREFNCWNDWYEQASYIARQANDTSVRQLLQASCR